MHWAWSSRTHSWKLCCPDSFQGVATVMRYVYNQLIHATIYHLASYVKLLSIYFMFLSLPPPSLSSSDDCRPPFFRLATYLLKPDKPISHHLPSLPSTPASHPRYPQAHPSPLPGASSAVPAPVTFPSKPQTSSSAQSPPAQQANAHLLSRRLQPSRYTRGRKHSDVRSWHVYAHQVYVETIWG